MQLNITNGNDVRLHILLMRDGSPFRADDSTDVSCALISLYGKRIQLPSFADQKDGSLIADIGHGTHRSNRHCRKRYADKYYFYT